MPMIRVKETLMAMAIMMMMIMRKKMIIKLL